ncbi:substrate-binding periplasmic protein [Chitinimonas sp.]|uniref:substrate-binding periplasmic protein n=1 Tax=Chitinimonas sp. TaxID=1934313 RepID=UPI002F91FA83
MRAGYRGLLLGLLLCGCLLAQAACERPLRVGVGALGAAYYQGPDGPQGIVVDLMTELSRRSGCTFRTEALPRQRLWAMYANGDIDLVPAALKTPERDLSGDFVLYAASRTDLLLRKRHSLATIRNMNDVQATPKLNLGLVRGVTPAGRIEGFIPGLERAGRIEYSPDFDQLFVKLQAGRLDAVLAPVVFYERKLKELGLTETMRVVQLPEAVFSPAGIYLQRKRIEAADRKRLTAAIESMRADGTVRAIYAKYLSAGAVESIMQGTVGLLPTGRKR